MKAIIFGSNGQDGFYLTELLKKQNSPIDVIGISRKNSSVLGDVSDYSFVEDIVTCHKPNFIFHFAANSSTHHEALFDNHNAISTGTLNILECVRKYQPDCKVFLSGSALQFKNDDLPIDEMTPFSASSAYSVARIHSTYAARYYRDTFGIKVFVGYFFNHDSPLRTEKHVNQKITAAVKRIANGSREKLELGNIEVKKEFSFAGDIVEAVWTLVNQEKNISFEAVIGSGLAYSIKEWLDYCFKKIGKNWEDYVIQKPNFISEYKILVSKPNVIKRLGWQPKVSFEQLADIMMDESS